MKYQGSNKDKKRIERKAMALGSNRHDIVYPSPISRIVLRYNVDETRNELVRS